MSKARDAAMAAKTRLKLAGALAMRRSGKTYAQIGEAFGVTTWLAMQFVAQGKRLDCAGEGVRAGDGH
jgi:hypothetical protein